ncbi:MAG: PQQ-dependent sugar dehydrogenase [Alphaproteobacteria bacterium]|nr:PQQ-dependent sugar dehydrogenase [Alphaproteobacteria bacterium]
MHRVIIPVGAVFFLSLAGVWVALRGFTPSDGYTPVKNVEVGIRLDTVASGLENPWSMAFMPDGRILVTERPGRLRIVSREGALSPPVSGLPEVHASGQAGLLDVIVDKDYAQSRRIFFSYAEPDGEGKAGTAVASAVLNGNRLEEVQVIFRQQPKVKGDNHWGSRLVLSPQGHLFVTTGDRWDHRDKVQGLDNHMGKVVRIHTDGSVPKDNPFVETADALPEVWSLGHRNMQGATWNAERDTLWIHEHGPRGGDEINEIAAGKNYGWPVVSFGRNYDLTKVGEGMTAQEGMEAPLFYWDPSIAPSGMVIYSGNIYPQWKGSLFVGALAGQALVRLTVDGTEIRGEERLLEAELGERIRDVRQAPDGHLYILTDSDDGKIIRIARADG